MSAVEGAAARLGGLFAAGALLAIWQAAASGSASATTSAVAYQINVAHDGTTAFKGGFAPPLKRKWVRDLGGPVSYPLIAKRRVFVTVGNTGTYGSVLYALSLKTGEILWQQSISGTYFQSNATYENGHVFEVNYDGRLQSFSEDTGEINWSVQLPIQWAFTGPPTAYNGRVYLAGAGDGGTLYAVDELSGALDWSAIVDFGDESSPAIGDGGVYVSYPCQYYKIDPNTGEQIWNYNGGCDGGGGKTPVYRDHQLYVRDPPNGDAIIDADSGTLVGMLATSAPPSFYRDASSGKRYMFCLWNDALYAVDLDSGNVAWSFAVDGPLASAPIVINDVVVEASWAGGLYLLDPLTGTELWSTDLGSNVGLEGSPVTGLGAGQGYLVVPAGNQISAFVGARGTR